MQLFSCCANTRVWWLLLGHKPPVKAYVFTSNPGPTTPNCSTCLWRVKRPIFTLFFEGWNACVVLLLSLNFVWGSFKEWDKLSFNVQSDTDSWGWPFYFFAFRSKNTWSYIPCRWYSRNPRSALTLYEFVTYVNMKWSWVSFNIPLAWPYKTP